jgi:hypothetical protein
VSDPIDALAQRLCDQQYPPGYNEDGISLPRGGWADGLADRSKAGGEFLEAWRAKARNAVALLADAGFDVVARRRPVVEPVQQERPTHLDLSPGDRHSVCGLRDPLPRVWVLYAAGHVKGHGMIVCPRCAEALIAMGRGLPGAA